METKVKAVIDLMATLGVKLKDVAAALNLTVVDNKPATKSPQEEISYGSTRNGLKYAMYKGNILGIVMEGRYIGKFILAKDEYRQNLNIYQARNLLETIPKVGEKSWIVPNDEHFRAIQNLGPKINSALCEISGMEMQKSKAYLSATSQENPPTFWNVRFVLPLD